MKIKLLLFFILLSLGAALQAQTSKTINLTAGNLSSVITNQDLGTLRSLTITGTIDARDFRFMRDKLVYVTQLDLSQVSIVAYKGTDGPMSSDVYEYAANRIPEYAFRPWTYDYQLDLSSVIFPASLKSIGACAFDGCSKLQSVNIPSTITKIEGASFRGCSSLTSLVIPASVDTIGPYAFADCKALTSLNLPSTIKFIDGGAFMSCIGLTSVTIPPSLTVMGDAFAGCTGLTQVVLPESITSLGYGAFMDCRNLKSINIPKGVTSIGANSFVNCTSLTSITIPSQVTVIGESIFSNCTNLTSVAILSPTMWTNNSIFNNCTKLTSLTVSWTTPPPGMDRMFSMVDRNLCTVYVPYGTASLYRENYEWNQFKNIIESSAGLYVSATTANVLSTGGSKAEIDLKANVAWTATSDQTWLTVNPASGTANSKLTFTAQANLSIGRRTAKVTVSAAGVESKIVTITQDGANALLSNVTAGSLISKYTTDQLSTITHLKLQGVIDARDFKTIRDKMPLLYELDLSEVNIAAYEGLEGTNWDYYYTQYPANTIPQYAFNKFPSNNRITSIALPASVTDIQYNAFIYGITALKVNNPLPIVFDYYDYMLDPLQPNCTIYVPYGSANRYKTALKWEEFTNIKEAAYGFNLSSYADTITGTEGTVHTINLSANVAWTISSDQDWLAVSPSSGNGNQTITFTAQANKLLSKRKATITVTGKGVSSQTISIVQDIQPQPEKILELTAGTLASVLSTDELNTISILTLKGTIDARDFKTMRDKMPLLAKLDLSGATIVAYIGNEGTSPYGETNYPANRMPDYAFVIKNPNTGFFSGKNTLTSVILPSSMTSFGKYVFGHCKNLAHIDIPTSVTSIGEQSFADYPGLKTVSIPSSVTSIGYYAFMNCSSLSSVIIPSSVTSIGLYAFNNCSSLTSIVIPSSVASIQEYAFGACSKLQSVTVNRDIPLAFDYYTPIFSYETTNTGVLNVPFGCVSRYSTANVWKNFKTVKQMPGIFLSSKTVAIESIEGSTSTIEISSDVNWTISCDQAWLTVSPASGTGLGQKLTFTAQANLMSKPRKAIVTISAPDIAPQIVTINQMPAPLEINLTAGGLSSLTTEELNTITNLTITGTIDARDFKTMRDKMPMLAKIDLSGAKIIEYTGIEGTSNWGSINYRANTIPPLAFYKSLEGKLNLTSIVFPQSLTSISEYAFNLCKGLKNVTIPLSVSSIGEQAFAYCTALSSITIENPTPPDLKYTNSVFYQVNKSLCTLNVPFSSAADYKNAYQWKDFTNISAAQNGFRVSNNTVNLAGTAGSFATISIFSNVEWTATSDQDWLKVTPLSGKDSASITFTAEENPSFLNARTAYVTLSSLGVKSQTITVVQSGKPQPPKTFEVIAGGLASALTEEELATVTDLTLTGNIDARDFKTLRDRMPMLERLDLSQVTIVAYSGTEGTKGVEQTTYPANTIPEYAFMNPNANYRGNYTLKNIIFPESLTVIGQYSFAICYALKDFVIPSSVLNIDKYAFYYCSGISNINIPASVTNIGLLAFGGLNSQIFVDPENSHYMSSNNVLFNKEQTELIQCINSKSEFYGIPSTVTTIGDYAFFNRYLLTSVSIPSSVTTIGKYSFYSCSGLTTLTIPSSVTSIGEHALYYCYGLRTIYANARIPVNLDNSPSVFSQIYDCKLYVPVGSKSAYLTASQWKDFWYIIEINPDLVAEAGLDQLINEGTLVTLNGSVITNTSGKPVSYKWKAPEGIILSSDTVANPTFTAPEVTSYSGFTLSLTIYDGLNYSAADEVYILVRNVNKPPVANAGIDQTVNENSMVTLDGSASFDPDKNYLSYEWNAPYPISLSYRYSAKPTFIAPTVTADTKYTFYLKVDNGYNSKTDTVVITVKNINQAPQANAGNMQIVVEGASVSLDGTYSKDPDGDALTFKWTAPEGISLSSTTSTTTSFTAPEVEQDTWFTIKLIVNDGKLDSYVAEVIVLVRNNPALLNLYTKVNGQTTPVYLNYKLFMEQEKSFILKCDTFAVTGDTLHLALEPGNWIALVAPARDPLACVPTYVGNVTTWNEAEIISMAVKSTTFREITCMLPEVAKTGVGQISGAIYEKPDNTTKTISISALNLSAINPPVINALVRLYRKDSEIPVASVFTDYQGYYKFDKLEIADYEIVVEIPGYIQSERFQLALTNIAPTTRIYFGVNTSSKVITDNNNFQLSMVKAYPNPTNGIIYMSGLPEKAIITVYTIDGKPILKKDSNLQCETIDISNQVPGAYIVVINEKRFKIFKK